MLVNANKLFYHIKVGDLNMQIRKMKRKDVRCIIEVVGDGSIITHYDESLINAKLLHFNKDTMVTIFEPTEEQKATLQQLLYKDGEDTIKANALQVVEAMKLITDLEGLDDITEEELIETIQAPDRVLDEINFEVGRVFTELITNHYERLSALNSLPKPILKAHLENEVTRIEAEQKEQEEKERAKQLLQEQMEELKAKMAEL